MGPRQPYDAPSSAAPAGCLLQGAKDTDQLLTLVVGNQTLLSDPTAANRRPVELLVAQVRAGLLLGQHKISSAPTASFLLLPDMLILV